LNRLYFYTLGFCFVFLRKRLILTEVDDNRISPLKILGSLPLVAHIQW